MLGHVTQLTIISSDALSVDLEEEKLARAYGLHVEVVILHCHPRSKTVPPLSHQQLGEAIPVTKQVAVRLSKQLDNPISLQYINRNYHVVKRADTVLAFTNFQPESNLCFGETGLAVEMAKLLKKVLYVYDVQRNIWFWYRHDQDLFYACDQMSRNSLLYLPWYNALLLSVYGTFIFIPIDALLELQDTFKRSLNIPCSWQFLK